MKRKVFNLLISGMLVFATIFSSSAMSLMASSVTEAQGEVELEYVATDKSVLELGEEQGIICSFEDGEIPVGGELQVVNETTGVYKNVSATRIDGNILGFKYAHIDESEKGAYLVTGVTVFYENYTEEILFADHGIAVYYGVETEVETFADDTWIVEDETTDEVECEVITFDENQDVVSSFIVDPMNATSAIANTLEERHGNVVVVLDPGHDSAHGGTQIGGKGYEEEKLNLQIALYCRAQLSKYSHVIVHMTRETENCPYPGSNSGECNEKRVEFAKSVDADIYVALHLNSSSSSTDSGVSVYYPNSNYNSNVSAEGKGVAEEILARLVALGLRDGGVRIRNGSSTYADGSTADYYGVIRNSKKVGIPAIIVEHAFCSNASDRENFLSDYTKLRNLGIADGKGIAQYYGLYESSYSYKLNTMAFKDYSGAQTSLKAIYNGEEVDNSLIQWSSTDENVVTVDDYGNITCKVNGKAVVCAYNTAIQEYAYCNVIVDNKLSLNQTNHRIYQTQGDTLKVYLNGTQISSTRVRWSSSNPKVATVSESGRLIGVAPGTTVITVTDGPSGTSTKCNLTVLPARKVTLNTSQLSVATNGTGTLTAYVDGKAATGMSWSSSNEAVATVDANGVITGLKGGTAVISCTTRYGTTATCTVTVSDTLTLSQMNHRLYQTQGDTLKVYLNGIQISSTRVRWSSSNPKVATVTESGRIIGVAPGTTVITVTDGPSGTSAKCNLTILPARKVTLSAATLSISTNGTGSLKVYVDGKQADASSMTWSSSNEAVATVDANGVISGLKGGTAVISCTTRYGTVAKCTVTIKDTLTLSQMNHRLYQTQGDTLKVYLNGIQISSTRVRWSSSNPKVATVSESGRLIGVAPGSTVITVTDGPSGTSAKCNLTILPARKVTLSAATLSISTNGTGSLKAYVDGKQVDASSMTWSSSNEAVATVDANGVISGLKGGTAVISCTTRYGTTAKCTVTIKDTLTLSQMNHRLYQTQGDTLKVYLNGIQISSTRVRWSSSNPKVATVSESGRLIGVAPGTTVITVTDGPSGTSAKCNLTILPARKVTLSAATLSISTNGTGSLKAYVDGKQVDASSMTWTSSDETVATVDANGVISGLKGGTAVISCTTRYGTTAKCTVTIKDTLTLSQMNHRLYQTQGDTLKVYLNGIQISSTRVRWSSSNPKVATVSESGRLIGVAPGTTVITVTDGPSGTSAKCNLTILPLKKVVLNTNSYTLNAGQGTGLGVTVDGVKVDPSQMTWTSSNEEVATVTSSGRILTNVKGTAIISCTTKYGTVAQCVINVKGYEIMGTSNTTVDQMVAYFNSKAKYPSYYANSDAPTIRDFCQIVVEEAAKEGVKAEVVFCQSMKETGFFRFGGQVDISQFNFGGLGATDGGAKGASFPNVRTGIRAQVQHLKCYASTDNLVQECVDPRFNLVQVRGLTVYVEWLGKRENPYTVWGTKDDGTYGVGEKLGWATGTKYGYSLVSDYILKLLSY